jgi:pilus assembly protein CpaE
MKIAIFAKNEKLLKELKRTVASQEHEVAPAVVRAEKAHLGQFLKQVESDVVIVDSACGAAEDIAAIEAFNREHPGVAVLLLCPTREPDALIGAMRAGVTEVLHSPPSTVDMVAALRRIAQRRSAGATGHGRILAFISCKGGSGATFLATNLGYVLATEKKKQVAFIDLDLQYGDASCFVSGQPGKVNVADVARQADRLDAKFLASSMTRVTPNYGLLSAPEEADGALDIAPEQIERVLEVARQNHDFVIVDVERMLDAVAIRALDKAELIFPVMEKMVPFIRDAKRLVRAFRALGYGDEKIRLIVNRYEKGGEINLEELERVVGIKVYHTVANSFTDVSHSINEGVPIVKVNARNPVSRALRAIADDLTEGSRPS